MLTPRRAALTALPLLLTACTAHAATHAVPVLSPSAVPTVVPAAASPSPSSSRVPVPVRRATAAALAALPVTTGVVAESVVGSSVVATAYRRSPAGPGQGPVTVVVFDPAATRLVLHPGTAEPGTRVAPGPVVTATERRRLVAAFNGGFKMKDARGGWMADGHVVVPLVRGAASVVTYSDGTTDIGAWGTEVPAAGRHVVSVRQNLTLLVDHGVPRLTHPSSQQQLNQWWGHAFQDAPLVSRSALGVTADGALVYAGGTRITVAALDEALLAHGVVRAMELDINAPLVRAFLYAEPAQVRVPVGRVRYSIPVVVGQTQGRWYSTTSLTAPHCLYVTSCPRDFFTVELR